MKLAQNRINPSSLTPEDYREVERLLAEVFSQPTARLVSAAGEELELPGPVFQVLLRVLSGFRDHKAMVLLPEDETFTTQAAAEFLGMSRPFFVGLLEQGTIPHHRVGSHRRVYLKDLLDYQQQRDQNRRQALNEMTRSVFAAGLDDEA